MPETPTFGRRGWSQLDCDKMCVLVGEFTLGKTPCGCMMCKVGGWKLEGKEDDSRFEKTGSWVPKPDDEDIGWQPELDDGDNDADGADDNAEGADAENENDDEEGEDKAAEKEDVGMEGEVRIEG